MNRSYNIALTRIAIPLIAITFIILSGCDYFDSSSNNGPIYIPGFTDRIAHPDTLYATVNGQFVLFQNLSTIISGRFYANGSSDLYMIHLEFPSTSVRKYTWSDTYATINSFVSLRNVGGLTILEYNEYDMHIRGTFQFSAVTSKKDTIVVDQGYFSLHYVYSDD